MGGLAEAQVADAVDAVVQPRPRRWPRPVVGRDDKLDDA